MTARSAHDHDPIDCHLEVEAWRRAAIQSQLSFASPTTVLRAREIEVRVFYGTL
jgi:hypothetical protein